METLGLTREVATAVLLLASTALGAAPTGGMASITVDVALAEGGKMQGQLVDSGGNPIAEQSVSVFYEGRVVAQSITNDQGYFSVSGLRGGSHILTTPSSSLICRLWNSDIAPPLAQSSLLMVSPHVTVRGQDCKHCGAGQGSCRDGGSSHCARCQRRRAARARCHYLLQPRALMLYAGLGAVVWQASDRSLSSPSL